MIKINDQSHGASLIITVGGKLNVNDYEHVLIPKLNELFEDHGKVRMLVEFEDTFSGWDSLGAAWDDMKLGLEHPNDYEKLALVGAPDWVEWGAKAFGIFFKGEVKSFPVHDKDAGLQWIKS